jgi:hypothetical protein
MVSTRYLGGKRMTDYAYAMTMLQSFQDQAGAAAANPQGNQSLKTVFGDAIRAGQKFYGMQEQVAAGKASALVASDFGKALSVNGGDYADAPAAMEPAAERRTLSVQAKGEEKPIAVTAAAKARLLFVQDGFAPFGKVALGSAPGTIEVSVDLGSSSFGLAGFPTSAEASPVVSLDGGDEVDLPHVFESVSSGSHTIRIPEVRAGSKLYVGLEENVTVEPGKRLVFERTLSVGRARIHVDGIPEESKLFIDGDEQALVENPAGGMMFDGTVDAGTPRIDVVHGNKDWYCTAMLPNDDSATRSFSVDDMEVLTTLQQKSIRLKGQEADWAGIDPVFTGSGSTNTPRISGSQIAGGSVCRDGRNLYVRIDCMGKPDYFSPGVIRRLELSQSGHKLDLQLEVAPNGGQTKTSIYDEASKRWTPVGEPFEVGSSFIEMRFGLSLLSEFDFSKPIHARLTFFQNNSSGNNYTVSMNGSPFVDLIFGEPVGRNRVNRLTK